MFYQKSLKEIFLCFFLLLSLFPLLSSAQNQFLPTGPGCNPGLIPDDSDMPDFVVCPYLEENGSIKLRLTWELNDKTFEDPVCLVGCNRLDGGSCAGASQGDGQGIGTSTLDVSKWNLKPKDEIVLSGSDIREGNIYFIGCMPRPEAWGKVAKGLKGVCDEPDSCMGSTKAKIENSGAVCEEVPFDQIINSLNSFKPVTISERNVRSWSSSDAQDRAVNGGSGDMRDIYLWMSSLQGEGVGSPLYGGIELDSSNSSLNADTILSYFRRNHRQGNAVPLSFTLASSTVPWTAHGVIFLSLLEDEHIDPMTGSTTIRIAVLDSNDNEIIELTCFREIPWILWRVLFGLKTMYYCDEYGGMGYETILRIPSQINPTPYRRNLERMQRNAVRQETARWLEDLANRPDFGNFCGPSSPDGTCGGWAEAVLRMAYLGEFDPEGKDCHPNGSFSQNKTNNFLAQLFHPLNTLWNKISSIWFDKIY